MSKLFVILVAVVTIGCVHYQNIFNPSVIEDAIESLTIVRTEGVAEIGGSEVKREMRGTAIHLKDGYILALTHTTKTPRMHSFRTPFGYMPVAQKVLSEKWFINDDEITLVGRFEDISLFKSNSKKVFPFKLGNSDKVRVGTKTILIGWSLGKAINLKNGIVSRTNIKEGTYGKHDKDCFLITDPVNRGDSGSPLLAYRKDNSGFEIIGIVNAGIHNKGMGFALKSLYVMNALKKIKQEAK